MVSTTGYYFTADGRFDAVENLSKKEYGKKARKEVWKLLPDYKKQGISKVLGITNFWDLEKVRNLNLPMPFAFENLFKARRWNFHKFEDFPFRYEIQKQVGRAFIRPFQKV